jgi:chromosome segregation ATPase
MLVGPKGITIIAILFGLIAMLSAGLAVTATSKYRTQRHRVTELEERLMAGKAELVKVPKVQLALQEEQKKLKGKEDEINSAKEELESLRSEYEGFKHEHELLGLAKVVSDRELQQRDVALQEAKAKASALDDRVKELEGVKAQLERKITDLDLDYRAALTKIKNLEKGGGGATMAPISERHEVVPTAAAEGGGELQNLRAKVAELTNELIGLTKSKQQAEREVEELQRRLASLPSQQ